MLDVFFLSYNEPYADQHFRLLLERVPYARRVHGVRGFYQAHRACAEQSLTHNFYVVDADALIVDAFDFTFKPSKFNKWYDTNESDCLCVWSSINPVNGLIYGYGGVKLLPKLPLLKQGNDSVDFTTGFGLNIKVFNEISNVTAFNQDPFSTWRSAFRECTKLAINLTNEELKHKVKYDYSILEKIYKDTNDRLDVWCTKGKDAPFGQFALDGARRGKEYGLQFAQDSNALKLINDYDWMTNEFNEFYRQQ